MPRALIAGAGIGGLSVALALDSAGFDVAIFERMSELAEFGAGLQITPNATRILERLGALEPTLAAATEPTAIVIRNGRDDKILARLDISDARKRWGAPYIVVHRADLQRALADVAATRPHIELKLGLLVGGVAESADGVAFGLKRGAVAMRENGDVAIGADGLNSKVRERLGLGEPDDAMFSGRVAFRATAPASELDDRFSEPLVNLRLGPRAHLVHYPLRGGAIVNFVAVIESSWRGQRGDDPWDGEADRDALERAFADWSDEARELVADACRLARLAAETPAADRELRRRPHRAGGRRSPSDGSVPRPGRGAGDRRRRRAVAPSQRDARCRRGAGRLFARTRAARRPRAARSAGAGADLPLERRRGVGAQPHDAGAGVEASARPLRLALRGVIYFARSARAPKRVNASTAPPATSPQKAPPTP